MDRRLGLFVAVALVTSPAHAAESWTFCVASDLETRTAWLSAVFATQADRVDLEGAFQAYAKKLGAKRAVAQCPLPKADHTEVANDRLNAEQFNRKLGATVREVAASEFSPKR